MTHTSRAKNNHSTTSRRMSATVFPLVSISTIMSDSRPVFKVGPASISKFTLRWW